MVAESSSSPALFLVTGASRGIGEALTRLLLSGPGAHVVGFSRNHAAFPAESSQWEHVVLDLAHPDEAASLFDENLLRLLLQSWSRVVLVQNAGILEPVGNVGSLDLKSIQQNLVVNLLTPTLLTEVFVGKTQHLPVPKQLLYISSGAARRPSPGWSSYAAAKAGLDQFANCLAAEQISQEYPVRVASLAPGVVDTDMQAFIRTHSSGVFPGVGRFIELKKTGALTSPEEAAANILRYLNHTGFGEEVISDLRTFPPA